MRASLDRLIAAFGLLALALPAAAQAPAGQPEEFPDLFGETIEVRVVNVEVVVTDRQGNRVTGLGPSDFRLRVDGKEAPIEYFTEVRGGDAVVPEAAAASATVQGLPTLAPGSPVGTSYLVFIDDEFSISARRNEVLRDLKDDLVHLQPEDRMAIVAFDGRQLEMLSSWSQSGNALARVIDQAMGRPAHGFEKLAELRSFETTSSLSAGFPGVGGVGARRSNSLRTRLSIDELSYAQRLANQLDRSVRAATLALRGFAAPPGRKVMLLLSGGWPFSIAEYVTNDPGRVVVDRDVPDGEDLLRPLADTANRLGYTIYPVDVPGVGFEGPGADAQGPSAAGLPLREQEIHASLEFVAEQTGGRPLLNALRAKAFETAESDTRSYYWLGFSPPQKGDDARHEVDVDVLRPGLTVRARESYLDLSRKGEVTMMVESVMLFGGGPGTESLPMQLGEPVRDGRREVLVPLTLAIPSGAVTTVPVGGKHAAELELRVAAVDERGDRSDVPVIPLRLTFDQPLKPGRYITYETKLRLRRLRQHLVIALFDPLSGKLLLGEADVNPK